MAVRLCMEEAEIGRGGGGEVVGEVLVYYHGPALVRNPFMRGAECSALKIACHGLVLQSMTTLCACLANPVHCIPDTSSTPAASCGRCWHRQEKIDTVFPLQPQMDERTSSNARPRFFRRLRVAVAGSARSSIPVCIGNRRQVDCVVDGLRAPSGKSRGVPFFVSPLKTTGSKKQKPHFVPGTPNSFVNRSTFTINESPFDIASKWSSSSSSLLRAFFLALFSTPFPLPLPFPLPPPPAGDVSSETQAHRQNKHRWCGEIGEVFGRSKAPSWEVSWLGLTGGCYLAARIDHA